jgi:hypothetical protein
MPAKPAATPAKTLSAPQKALIKLGLVRDIDLALHLPLRYEDETRIVKLRDVREGDTAQIEATVTACEITMRPRRQLLVTVDDGSDTCVMRFFSFYPSHQKALAVGARWLHGIDHDAPDFQGRWRHFGRGFDAGVFHGGRVGPGVFAPRGDHGPEPCGLERDLAPGRQLA